MSACTGYQKCTGHCEYHIDQLSSQTFIIATTYHTCELWQGNTVIGRYKSLKEPRLAPFW